MKKHTFHSSPKYLGEIKDLAGSVDFILEVVDARAPEKTRNPIIKEIASSRKIILILNKADLAYSEITARWVSCYQKNGLEALSFEPGKPANSIINLINQIKTKALKPRFKRALRIMVAGTPNVGKSTILNSLLKRKAVKTGDIAGITRGKQWIRLKPGLELLDTAGILPPFISQSNRFYVALLGIMPSSQWDPYEVAAWLLREERPHKLIRDMEERYKVKNLAEKNAEDILLTIGAQRGTLRSGGEIDLNRVTEIFLKEFRGGLLGRYSLEKPPETER